MEQNLDNLTLKIKVYDNEKERITINLPFALAKLAIKLKIDTTINQASNSLRDVDLKYLVDEVENGKTGEILKDKSKEGEDIIVTVE